MRSYIYLMCGLLLVMNLCDQGKSLNPGMILRVSTRGLNYGKCLIRSASFKGKICCKSLYKDNLNEVSKVFTGDI